MIQPSAEVVERVTDWLTSKGVHEDPVLAPTGDYLTTSLRVDTAEVRCIDTHIYELSQTAL